MRYAKVLGAIAILGFATTNAFAQDVEPKMCLLAGVETIVEDDFVCPGTVAAELRKMVVEKQRPKIDIETGQIMLDAETGLPVMETYEESYRKMVTFAREAGLGDAFVGGEFPHLHNGYMENNIVTVFAIEDNLLQSRVDALLDTAEQSAPEPLSDEDRQRVIYQVVGSQIATRPYYKSDMWNGQRDFRNLGGGFIQTNFLTETGDEANGLKFQQYDIIASNGVIHLLK